MGRDDYETTSSFPWWHSRRTDGEKCHESVFVRWQRQVVTVPRLRGRPACGRIAKLFVGQSYGFIRTVDGREIFFHRGDIQEGTSFNDFAVGDGVAFELLEDRISGPRALYIQRRPYRRLRQEGV